MKILVIGDIHGRTIWKEIVRNEFDKVVFIGDYFDSRDNISGQDQLENFNNIIEFKRSNSEKVVLLTGNHDEHYLKNVPNTYSGFQPAFALDFQEAIYKALNGGLMQMCYIWESFLFTHAGVTNTWLKNVGWNGEPLDVFINDLFKCKPSKFHFTVGRNWSQTGDDVCQTPIWVRPRSLTQDGIENYTQIVGHTSQNKLSTEGQIILVDTLGTSGEYLCIEDFVLTALKV